MILFALVPWSVSIKLIIYNVIYKSMTLKFARRLPTLRVHYNAIPDMEPTLPRSHYPAWGINTSLQTYCWNFWLCPTKISLINHLELLLTVQTQKTASSKHTLLGWFLLNDRFMVCWILRLVFLTSNKHVGSWFGESRELFKNKIYLYPYSYILVVNKSQYLPVLVPLLIKNASVTLTNFLDDIRFRIENEGRILIQSHYNDENRRDSINYSHYSVRDKDFLIRERS